MTTIKPVAFYLPQFHPTRVNDMFWRQGFSDWSNVAKAKPLFPGHFQPRLPGALGFYDLRAREVLEEQADLARYYGLHGFCFYYYRFDSKRVLNRPIDNFLETRKPDFPFMYCWANEIWTRAWDGKSDEVILNQTYDEETFEGLVTDLTRAMRDYRYLRVDGKPLFLVYQIELVPEAEAWVEGLRQRMFSILGEEILVGCVYSHGFKPAMLDWVDLVVQFPPHRLPRISPRRLLDAERVQPFDLARGDFFEAYAAVAESAIEGVSAFRKMLPGVTPDWDNSPRRPNAAHMLVGSTPELFATWVEQAGRIALQKAEAKEIPDPVLFINAWNEWGEGAMLEPSDRHGAAYLEALRTGLDRANATASRASGNSVAVAGGDAARADRETAEAASG